MDLKQFYHKSGQKVKELWRTGKIQRSSRITYDVFWNVILFFLIVGFIGMFFAGGLGAGYFASLVKDEPVRPYEVMADDIYNYEETSKLYFADDIYIGNVQADLFREDTSLEDVSPVLINAVIATEDDNFNEHDGIVPSAILRAIVQEATNADTRTGGSTLTQQLIKNQILTDEVSFERKAQEILLAMRLERFFEKEEILEAYLNIVPFGRNASGDNIAGIQTAAQGIFGIDAEEINLPQAAFLAGLPQSPSAYTPFTNQGELKDENGMQPGINRMKSVLSRMLDSGYITEDEYDEAMEYDITADFTEGAESPLDSYPYLTYELQNRAKDILKTHLAEQDGYTEEDLEEDADLNQEYDEMARRDLRVGGYDIHSTIDKEIYDLMQRVAKEYQYYGPTRTFTEEDPDTGEMVEKTNPLQTAAMLIENNTGRIISFVGGREHSQEQELNYATQATRSPGSTIKPLLDYAPAMEKGRVQPGTPIADYDRNYPNWNLGNYGGGHYGIVSARTAHANSYNIPAAEVYLDIMDERPSEEYLEKMGISTLSESDHEIRSLSIGAMDRGVYIEENINAFSTFGNNGQFADGFMIEKITTEDGDIVYEHETEEVEVFSPQTNYLMIDMMRSVISEGTGQYLNSQLRYGSVDWAGKTGTSNDYHDAWFVATNPNVTFGTWMGYDTPHSIYETGSHLSYSRMNMQLWADLINAATDNNPDLLAPSDRFTRPDGIVERSYCAISGMLPSDLCEEAGLVKTDIFNEKYVPTEEDDSLISGNTVMVDGNAVVAGPDTPSEFVEGDGLAFNPDFLERMGWDELSDLTQLYPRTETEKWEKISVSPSNTGASSSIEDTGSAPSAPSVSSSGSNLSWDRTTGQNIVGYRVYRASESGGSFSRVGSTTDTDYSIDSSDGVYHVKAVDYFGRESSASNEVSIGDGNGNDSADDSNGNDNGDENNDNNNNGNNNDDENRNDEESNNGENGNGNGNSGNGNGSNGTDDEEEDDEDDADEDEEDENEDEEDEDEEVD
ncbi:transglycosylase domain-containing protein [Virgibacillus kimchii]